MSAAFLLLLPFLVMASPARKPAPATVDARARAVFGLCYQEVLKNVKTCPEGECGKLLGGCYAKQLETIEADSRTRLLRIQKGACVEEADSFEVIQADLKAALESSWTFQERWKGMELRVEAALLRNHVLKGIEEECRK